jgi:hypothetical protein
LTKDSAAIQGSSGANGRSVRARSTSFAPELETFCTRQATRNLRPPNPILPEAKIGKRGSFLRSCTSILQNLRQQTAVRYPLNHEHDLYEFHADTMHGLPDDFAVMNMPIASDHEIERFGKAQRACDFEARALVRQIAHRATDSSGAIELNRAALEDPASRRAPAFDHGSRVQR